MYVCIDSTYCLSKTYYCKEKYNCGLKWSSCKYDVVQFPPLFKFYFHLYLGVAVYGNEFKTKDKKN